MRFSELPLMTPALFKHKGAAQSTILEITKLGLSKSGRAAYIRVGVGLPGQSLHMQHYWRDVAVFDEQYEFVDLVG